MKQIKTLIVKQQNKSIIWCFFLILFSNNLYSQNMSVRLNAYGHTNFESVFSDTTYSNFSLGEQELFINGKFNDNFSFLGEITLNYSGHSNYRLNIERLRLKYNYYKNHSLIIGKFHTPVNYWNDVYFHARLFFPTIDRPLMFSKWIPVHTFGMRLQGQNIGEYNFGYDLLFGSGMGSEDVYNVFDETSITAALHWKPNDETRYGFSYYYTSMEDASNMARHSHGDDEHNMNMYTGPLDFHMLNASFAYFGEKWEVLNEFSFNLTNTDTLGTSNNVSNYIYLGRRFLEKNVAFTGFDILYTGENDLHTYPYDRMKFILGYKYEYSENLNLKAQVEYYTNVFDDHSHISSPRKYEFKIQMSYGL